MKDLQHCPLKLGHMSGMTVYPGNFTKHQIIIGTKINQTF